MKIDELLKGVDRSRIPEPSREVCDGETVIATLDGLTLHVYGLLASIEREHQVACAFHKVLTQGIDRRRPSRVPGLLRVRVRQNNDKIELLSSDERLIRSMFDSLLRLSLPFEHQFGDLDIRRGFKVVVVKRTNLTLVETVETAEANGKVLTFIPHEPSEA